MKMLQELKQRNNPPFHRDEITADTEGEKIFCVYVINSVVDRGPGAIFR